MAITATSTNGIHRGQVATGAHLDDAATPDAFSHNLGFDPRFVMVANETDGDPIWYWFEGMTSAHAIQASDHDTAQFTKLTSGGITVSNGTIGFTVTQNKQYRWMAIG